ncbi:hypothetical protein H5410_032983 [Solanum commersonii]|uniref:Uncharacterized protein n=1 Tax=Solanum commersonii TaxID=4109 RepID=A0A9J5YNT5_SOLCO|nr:hypothetical protein H5410_032983 [Solanum commersonii]
MGLSFSLVLRISWEKGKWRRKLPIKKAIMCPKQLTLAGFSKRLHPKRCDVNNLPRCKQLSRLAILALLLSKEKGKFLTSKGKGQKRTISLVSIGKLTVC